MIGLTILSLCIIFFIFDYFIKDVNKYKKIYLIYLRKSIKFIKSLKIILLTLFLNLIFEYSIKYFAISKSFTDEINNYYSINLIFDFIKNFSQLLKTSIIYSINNFSQTPALYILDSLLFPIILIVSLIIVKSKSKFFKKHFYLLILSIFLTIVTFFNVFFMVASISSNYIIILINSFITLLLYNCIETNSNFKDYIKNKILIFGKRRKTNNYCNISLANKTIKKTKYFFYIYFPLLFFSRTYSAFYIFAKDYKYYPIIISIFRLMNLYIINPLLIFCSIFFPIIYFSKSTRFIDFFKETILFIKSNYKFLLTYVLLNILLLICFKMLSSFLNYSIIHHFLYIPLKSIKEILITIIISIVHFQLVFYIKNNYKK